MANTPKLDLVKPPVGSTGWGGDVDDNFDKIDAAVPIITGTPDVGKIPIGQGDGTFACADPLVQGIQPDGTTIATGGLAGGAINPVMVCGADGTGKLKTPLVGSSGSMLVNVENFPGTQPVSAASLPLPSGAATGTKQDTANTSLASIDGKLPASPAQEHTAAATPSAVRLTDGAAFFKPTTPSDTQPISAASLPLPTGAATLAKQPAFGTAGSASADVITVQGAASMTKLLVTPDSVALPAHQSANVDQIAGTTPDTNSGNKSSGTLRVVLATDQPALTNKILVTPDSVALPANQSTNVNQLAGTATDTNSGNKSAGTLRVVLATDQPALTNKLLVTPDSVALPANQSVNLNQLAGTTPDTNSGNKSAGTQRVVLATDQPELTIPTQSRPAAPTTAKWTLAAVTFSASGDTDIVAGVAAQTIRIMRLLLVNSDLGTPTNITIKDTTPTSFSGAMLLKSGGSINGDGEGEPLFVTASGKGFRINSSAAVQISGTVWYTQS